MKKLFKNKKGFTLTELLVVIFVISVISAIALPQYIKVLKKARNQEAIFNLRILKRAQESYFLLNGSYTKNLDALDIDLNSRNFYYECRREDIANCYAFRRDGRRPFFEQSSTSLYCRGSYDDCKDLSIIKKYNDSGNNPPAHWWVVDTNL